MINIQSGLRNVLKTRKILISEILKPSQIPNGIKLRDASLCLNCDELYVKRKNTDCCPACGDRSSVLLTTFLKPLRERH